MKVTSAIANKMIKKYQQEIDMLDSAIRQNAVFDAAINENIEDARPDFDFEKTYNEIRGLEEKIVELKHHLNVFNTKTEIEIDGKKFTIDKLLVYVAQLNKNLFKIGSYVECPVKKRLANNGNLIEYRYINFSHDFVKNEHERLSELVNEILVKLDTVNSTVEFEIPDNLS